jgi:CMP-N,N'-diacetyllegionaminic acid synthase
VQERTYSSTNHQTLFVIPARGGSKSLPGKNLKNIGESSLLELAIKSAPDCLVSNNNVVVTSDEDDILAEARKFGALGVKRSKSASSDNSTATDVIQDLLSQEEAKSLLSDNSLIIYLQPTSPLRRAQHVLEALEIYNSHSIPVVSVKHISEYPQKMLQIQENGRLQTFMSESNPTANRQELPKLLIPNGAIYIFSILDFKSKFRIPVEGALPYFMSQEDSVDIDSQTDLIVATAVFNSQNS